MNRTVVMAIAGGLTALVMTVAFILGGTFSRSEDAQASAGTGGTEPAAVQIVEPAGTPGPGQELDQLYQQQLNEQLQRIQQAYQQQLQQQMEQLRQEYERQLRAQVEQLRQAYEAQLGALREMPGQASQTGQPLDPQQVEQMRQAYEQQLQALRAAWEQRERAYQAQLQEAVRRLEAANAQIRALSQGAAGNTQAVGPAPGVQGPPVRRWDDDDGRAYEGYWGWERGRYEHEREEYEEHEEYDDD